MNTYYTGKHASRYNRTWRTFLQKTLSATLSAIDAEALQQRASTLERPLRILDAACGTGLLLEQFTHLLPLAELYGIDESQAMLTQDCVETPGSRWCLRSPSRLISFVRDGSFVLSLLSMILQRGMAVSIA